MSLTLASPLPRRLAAWLNERFAPANGVMFLALYAAALLFGRALVTPGPLEVRPTDALGFAGFWCFFLMLRIFDEHKDYASDCVAHPERVLQRGLVTLRHLKVVLAFAVAVQALASVARDGGLGPVTLTWAVTLAYSLLLAREFFAGAWLRKQPFLYAFSHSAVLCLGVLWVAQIGAAPKALPAPVCWLSATAFAPALAFEIARKLRAPGRDSYVALWGTRTATAMLVAMVWVGLASLVAASRAVASSGAGSTVAWAVAALVSTAMVLRFAFKQERSRAKWAEAGVGLALLCGYVAFSASLLSSRGLRWA